MRLSNIRFQFDTTGCRFTIDSPPTYWEYHKHYSSQCPCATMTHEMVWNPDQSIQLVHEDPRARIVTWGKKQLLLFE